MLQSQSERSSRPVENEEAEFETEKHNALEGTGSFRGKERSEVYGKLLAESFLRL